MPNIYDNIERHLLPTLRETFDGASRADICVGYFHLRGWDSLADLVERFSGTDESCCRVLVGMQRPPREVMRELQGTFQSSQRMDGPAVARLRRQAAESFQEQIEFGLPTRGAEMILRRLALQLRNRQVRVKVFLRHPLHAKLYLALRQDAITPLIGYLGSSNLTFAGLKHQGELNVDVVDQDAAQKLQRWFDDRWNDALAFDISDQLVELIETSWAREELIPPYHVYLKIAYYLSQEARQGEREFPVPSDLEGVLLDYQIKAVQLAAHHLHQRGGVLLGDVVGLGKTLMATAVAKILQEDEGYNVLIICPPKLREMWEWYREEYGLLGKVESLGSVDAKLPDLRRYRLVIIDESHNLRNREGRRYRAIEDYITDNDCQVMLLTATPFNKQYTDLSNQLRLIVREGQDLRVRPERFFQEWAQQGFNEADFVARFQASARSLRAFEQSSYADDWRDLMRLFLVRRTREFIIRNYAELDPQRQRHYVSLNNERYYFPIRQSRAITFPLNEADPSDQYARLFQESVVDIVNALQLPRYGLKNHLVRNAEKIADAEQKRILDNLNRAGTRLIGFCRVNLFKRLESSGHSFLVSLNRHVLRNMVTLHALEHGLPVPIGTQNAALLDTAITDADEHWVGEEGDGEDGDQQETLAVPTRPGSLEAYAAEADRIYRAYWGEYRHRFSWLDARFFGPQLKRALLGDARRLLSIVGQAGQWDPDADAKLDVLHRLLADAHPNRKVLVFTQFADTAAYLADRLTRRGVADLELATAQSGDPTALARRFSPGSNGGLRSGEQPIRVLIATDVLAEGQNLQDANIVVNFDLPWAIIRLIQRVGRVDRIGQKHDTIVAYSFWPADGVEEIIKLRTRLSDRLERNREVIGSDESFFGEDAANALRDLYTEKAGILDAEQGEDVDLTSAALEVWNAADKKDQEAAMRLPPLVVSARAHEAASGDPDGLIAYLRFPDQTDALVRVDESGQLVSQSLSAVFDSARCTPDTPPVPRADGHYDLLSKAVAFVAQEQIGFGGQLGSLRSTRRKVYERVKQYRDSLQSDAPLFAQARLEAMDPMLDALLRYPLTRRAREALGRELRLGITDEALVDMLIQFYVDERLCHVTELVEQPEPQIVCSLGLRADPLPE